MKTIATFAHKKFGGLTWLTNLVAMPIYPEIALRPQLPLMRLDKQMKTTGYKFA
ncbi:MAG: hypothetical protein LBO71_05835 [Prevotellaceae bacterium]|jgi:hypothetical protein|nr:hypothetical protein [Prevotellaceae bacterium]